MLGSKQLKKAHRAFCVAHPDHAIGLKDYVRTLTVDRDTKNPECPGMAAACWLRRKRQRKVRPDHD